jgi:hypothetical protein
MNSIWRVISADEETAVCFPLEEGMETASEEPRSDVRSKGQSAPQTMIVAAKG